MRHVDSIEVLQGLGVLGADDSQCDACGHARGVHSDLGCQGLLDEDDADNYRPGLTLLCGCRGDASTREQVAARCAERAKAAPVDEWQAALGVVIARARRLRDMTQADVAVRMGISQSHLSKLECGRSAMSVVQLRACALALDSDARSVLASADREFNLNGKLNLQRRK